MARIESLDRIRGGAIALMMLDHGLALTQSAPAIRLTLTRAALPLFALVAGHLLRHHTPSDRRIFQLWAAAIVTTAIIAALPFMARFDILISFALAMTLWPLARRRPLLTLILLGTILANWPAWPGYHPAAVFLLLIIGYQTEAQAWTWGERLPRTLAPLGRWPLSIYVGHLGVLALISLAYPPRTAARPDAVPLTSSPAPLARAERTGPHVEESH